MAAAVACNITTTDSSWFVGRQSCLCASFWPSDPKPLKGAAPSGLTKETYCLSSRTRSRNAWMLLMA
eukprot:3452965-Rhodomonas_salina.1